MALLDKLIRKYRIVSAPKFEPFSHSLGEKDENVKLYDVLKERRSNLLHTFTEGQELRQFDTVVALLDPQAALPVAFTYFFETGLFRGDSAIFERFLWKDVESDSANFRLDGERLPVYTVLNVFLRDQDIFVSDQKHTVFGYEWWDRLVRTKALPSGLKVYVENEHQKLIEVTAETYEKHYKKLMWGDEPKHLDRRLILSKKELL